MRKFLLLIFIVSSVPAWAQHYGDVWLFGDKAGVDFSSCSPRAITNGKNQGFEGCASIADSTGHLLFYTNSDSVWNRQHVLMPNGNINTSSGSLSQVIIVPRPGHPEKYYIVTTMIQGLGLAAKYHEIDMTLDGGLGDVISIGNILTDTVITEQVAATYHNNGTDIWIMVHAYGTNSFMAFLLTSSGISATPVISHTGPAHAPCVSNMNSRGEIKFSPDGSRIAFNGNGTGAADSSNILAVLDFNNTTGMVSNPIELPYFRGDFGLSFSPDNSKLYGSTWKAFGFTAGDQNYLYQYDLSAPNPAATGVVLDSTDVYGSVKIGPDGKVYLIRYNAQYLGVIKNPNLAGAACNYEKDGLYLGGRYCRFGLNNYIEYKNYCQTNTVGIDEQENPGKEVLAYPSPSSGKFTLQFQNPENKNYTLVIYDIQGRLVTTRNNISGQMIDLEGQGFLPGLYFFRLQSGADILHGKLLLE